MRFWRRKRRDAAWQMLAEHKRQEHARIATELGIAPGELHLEWHTIDAGMIADATVTEDMIAGRRESE